MTEGRGAPYLLAVTAAHEERSVGPAISSPRHAYTLYSHCRGNQSLTAKGCFCRFPGLPVGLRMAAARQP
ncbi:hypothetical protein J3B00_004646 [Pseudomonas sp. BP8]|nr:hypothetical protein [Pseudomonas sp. BP8]